LSHLPRAQDAGLAKHNIYYDAALASLVIQDNRCRYGDGVTDHCIENDRYGPCGAFAANGIEARSSSPLPMVFLEINSTFHMPSADHISRWWQHKTDASCQHAQVLGTVLPVILGIIRIQGRTVIHK